MARTVRQRRATWAARILLASSTALAAPAFAQDATWSATPENATFGGRADYTAPGNWVGGTVPTGTATFDATSETDIFFDNRVRDQHVMIGRFVFTAGAPAYTFTLESDELSFTGQGIVNNSSAIQTLIAGNRSTLHFTNSSSAGNASLRAQGGTGSISFEGSSNAGTATITAGIVASAGGLQFRHNSSAANATISNPAGSIIFLDASTAGNATIDNRNLLTFRDTSSIGNATITNNALIRMFMSANGPAGTIVNNAGATIDISAAAADNPAASVSIGSLSGAGNVRLGARNLTLGGLNRTETISGAITEAGGDVPGTGGSLTKIGTGTLTLSGASTYTGATTVNGGTLLLTGSIAGAGATLVGVAGGANGRLTVQGGATMTSTGDAIIGRDGGVGEVRVTGPGSRWTIGGTLTTSALGQRFQTGTSLGTLRIDAGGTVTSNGAIINQLQARSSLVVVSGSGTTWNTGAFTANGTANLTGNLITVDGGATMNSTSSALFSRIGLSGAGTVWNSGALVVGSPSGINPGRLTIADGAVVNSASGQIGGAVQGTASGSTSSGVVDVSAGRWNVRGDLRIGIDALNFGSLLLRSGGTVAIASGAGTAIVAGGSQLTIGGATTAAPGTLNAARVDLVSAAQLTFAHNSSAYLFAPVISGSGNVNVTVGTTILTGDSSAFAGTTTIDAAGILQIGNGGGGGSLAGNIANNSVLVINRTGALTLGGLISGTGTFTQNGTVTTTLSGASTYTGATTLNGGTLLVTGAIGGSAVTVNDTATLSGTGTVGPTTIASGGSLAPGTSIGTLGVAGNLSFATGSNFLVEVSPAAADRVNVTGTASLAGTLNAIALGGTYTTGQQYTVLTAGGGISGTFGSLVTQGSFGGLAPSLSYIGNDVILTLAAAGPRNSATSSFTDTIAFNPPTIEVRRVSLFETRIIGRLAGGTPLFDQSVADAFGSTAVRDAITAARLAITAAGAPGIVIVSDPVLVSRAVTSATTSASIFSLAGTSQTVTTVTTFGPATITIGDRRSCSAAIAALPSGTRPSCAPPGGTRFTVDPGTLNIDTNTQTTYTVNEARTDTITETTRETYELTGTIVPVGTVHAAVQSGLFDSAGRFLHRLGREGARGLFGSRGGAGRGGGWAEAYVLDGGRDPRNGLPGEQGDSAGFAAGFGLNAAPGVSLGFGADHGWTDIGVAANGETADVRLTQFGLDARLGAGPFGVGAALTYGAGEVDSSRAFMGVARGAYDVALLGAFVEARYDIDLGGWRLTPAAGLDWVQVESDTFTESGPLGFIVPAAEQDRTRAFAGAEIGGRLGLGGRAALELTGYARYLAVLDGEERALPIVFAAAPGTPLVMRGIDEEDSILLGAQARLELSRSVSLYFGYDGRFAGGHESHAGTGGIRVRW